MNLKTHTVTHKRNYKYLNINGRRLRVTISNKADRCVYCECIIRKGDAKVLFSHNNRKMMWYMHPECAMRAIRDFDWLTINDFKLYPFWLAPYDVAEKLGWGYPVKHHADFLSGLLYLIPYRTTHFYDNEKQHTRFWFFYEDVERFKEKGILIEQIIKTGREHPHPLVFRPQRRGHINQQILKEFLCLTPNG